MSGFHHGTFPQVGTVIHQISFFVSSVTPEKGVPDFFVSNFFTFTEVPRGCFLPAFLTSDEGAVLRFRVMFLTLDGGADWRFRVMFLTRMMVPIGDFVSCFWALMGVPI